MVACGLLMWAAIVGVGVWLDLKAVDPWRDIFGLEAGRLLRFYHTISLLTCAQLSYLILWRRSTCRKDFAGRYRVWFWVGAVSSVFCVATATRFHEVWAQKLTTGFMVTPRAGSSVVSGISLQSANDSPERDPASYKLEGSNDGGTTFAVISEGAVGAFSGRFTKQSVTFVNTKAYTSYRLTFPTVANGTAANSMQIAEVELLGKVLGPATAATVGIAKAAVGNAVVLSYTGVLQSAATVNGPYADVAGAVSPVTVTPAGAKFYRARQ